MRHGPIEMQAVDLAKVIDAVLEQYPHAKEANAVLELVQPLLKPPCPPPPPRYAAEHSAQFSVRAALQDNCLSLTIKNLAR